jgi:hypothetical protein
MTGHLLDRTLSAPEELMRTELERTLHQFGKSSEMAGPVHALLSSGPGAFCAAILSVLEAQSDEERRRSFEMVADWREFWMALLHDAGLSRDQLFEVCRFFMTIEETVDVRLARLTPGRQDENDTPLDSESVLRILDLLDKLSPGSRLILLLNHLTHHADRRIAAKATLLIGRRLRSREWVARQLDSTDGRVRASVVEGLWGVHSPAARNSLWASLRDKNNRVVGNALIGLHELGESGVNEFVRRMIEDPRPPFRWTAAWVMGKIGSEEFISCLQQALQDKETHVRRAAEQALDAIRQQAEAPALEATGSEDAAGGAAAEDVSLPSQ